MVATQYRLEFEPRKAAPPRRRHHYFFAALMFVAAYMTTITVNAQPQDQMVFNQNDMASVTGTVKDADENWVVITTAGKDMRIDLDDVDLNAESDTLFTPGMTVTADGRMNGEDFGVPVMKAKSIAATAPMPQQSADPIQGDARGGVLANQQ